MICGESSLPMYGTLYSDDGRYRAVMQDDGNLVIISDHEGGKVTWNSHKWLQRDERDSHLQVQADGNLVIYSPSGVSWWASHSDSYGFETLCSARPFCLIMQNDGNLVYYTSACTNGGHVYRDILWSLTPLRLYFYIFVGGSYFCTVCLLMLRFD
eukprot:TRINITY_DN35608_c0_g1_i3.p1 TRINITY_DN35608_c0_g1~~TRINITY_DN35608_c0_g1_i3.p1  ORF type:complete len:155 (+),score=0.86 TRINITY_DN35608_c0_g1_i3:61-525(+)